MKSGQPGFFDFEQRVANLGGKDPLARLDQLIEWEDFRPILAEVLPKEQKALGGRPRFDLVMMFKILVLQRLYNLSDEATEYQLKDRLSFMRFVGVDFHEAIPDEKTIWKFREDLRKQKVLPKLWKAFDKQLKRLGIQAGTGRIVDASIVETTRPPKKKHQKDETVEESRDTSEKMDNIGHSKRQVDHDARFTVKRKVAYIGYKNHIKIDAKTKLIQRSKVTTAEVHDSQVLPDLLTSADKGCEVYADKGYAGMGCMSAVLDYGARPRILHKSYRNKPVTEEQKQENRMWSKIRCRVEHVFGYQCSVMKGSKLRSVGFSRAEFTIQLSNLVYNFRRLPLLVGC